jgi:hypothetical protein
MWMKLNLLLIGWWMWSFIIFSFLIDCYFPLIWSHLKLTSLHCTWDMKYCLSYFLLHIWTLLFTRVLVLHFTVSFAGWVLLCHAFIMLDEFFPYCFQSMKEMMSDRAQSLIRNATGLGDGLKWWHWRMKPQAKLARWCCKNVTNFNFIVTAKNLALFV